MSIELALLVMQVLACFSFLFGAAPPLMIQEGSAGSLLVGMPWEGTCCQVEVGEFELVLAPYVDNYTSDAVGSQGSCLDNHTRVSVPA